MQNFYYDIPTKVYFGEGQIKHLPALVSQYGKRVLLVYGGGSVKRSGLYDTIKSLLEDAGITSWDLAGVEPNPRLGTVCRGVELCHKNAVDVIIPIGGGSTIDCAKAVAAGYYHEGSPWDLVLDNTLIKEALPIITVLTLAATGSEMDGFAVINNEETTDKQGMCSRLLYPRYSILDPKATFSVPKYQTAAGTADIMSHIFELYFDGTPDKYMQDRVMEGLLKTCIHFGPIACEDPEDYEARANLMWTSSWAINGFLACGLTSMWPVHAMEHQLSAVYDVTHGHGLAVLTPVWMRYILNDESVDRFVNYGVNVFGISSDRKPYEIAELAIQKTEEVFQKMGLGLSMQDIGIADESHFAAMAERAADGLLECQFPLDKEKIIEIYRRCLKK
ncbi:MAG: iron-containing alcohol dehydrogenase [Lachnospiraceae bacterium]|nr:iron-containing alcohol dehydrogenase [Lachnospiraceae bacterium]